MINDLKEEIKKQLSKEYKYVSNYMIESNLLNLLVLKYYCDTSNLKYENLISIENEKTKEIELPDDPLLKKILNVKFTKLLSHIRYENIQELIKEYLYHEDITLNIINSKEKKVCIPSAFSNSLYDLDGNTTYVIDYFKITPYEISKFQFFDKVLNNHNEYLSQEKIPFENYKNVYIYDDIPKYRFIKKSDNKSYEIINVLLRKYKHLKIILHTDYKKVSNLKDTKNIIKFMSKVILFEDGNTFLYYENNVDSKVSIINYNKEKIKNLSKLLEIIEKDRKQKDILVKTTTEEIINNYYRLGFRLYQTGTPKNKKNINEIVEENTNLIERLSILDKDIEQEINKLMNR